MGDLTGIVRILHSLKIKVSLILPCFNDLSMSSSRCKTLTRKALHHGSRHFKTITKRQPAQTVKLHNYAPILAIIKKNSLGIITNCHATLQTSTHLTKMSDISENSLCESDLARGGK